MFQVFFGNFSYVEAVKDDNSNEQPQVCSWPSDTFSLYIDFQNEIMEIIWGSDINEKRYAVALGDDWLFAQNILPLVQDAPAVVNIAATSVLNNLQSMSQATIVTTFLLELSAISVGESSIEWLWTVLFKDRPIVRDYRSLLQIETQLTQLTYNLSKKVSLIKLFQGDLLDNINSVIKKYQELWLLEETEKKWLDWWVTLVSVISDLVMMNASMKNFIVTNGTVFDEWRTLLNYNGCLNDDAVCEKNNAILRFSAEAVEQLKKDYDGIWVFWACNNNWNWFKSTIAKGVNNNVEWVKWAWKDIKDAYDRLVSALINKDTNDNYAKKEKCDMSYYEMAQLRAYYWNNWSCDSIEVDKSKSDKNKLELWSKLKQIYSSIKQYAKTKKDYKKLKQNTKLSTNSARYSVYGTSSLYSSEYKSDLELEFIKIYDWISSEYKMSEIDSASIDSSSQLVQVMALVKQVQGAWEQITRENDWLKAVLNEIANYQCAN